jgi:hypothetical protein
MTDNNTKPTSSGWWWAENGFGERIAIEVWIENGVIYDNRDPFKPSTVIGVSWIGPIDSFEEVHQLRQRIAELEAKP